MNNQRWIGVIILGVFWLLIFCSPSLGGQGTSPFPTYEGGGITPICNPDGTCPVLPGNAGGDFPDDTYSVSTVLPSTVDYSYTYVDLITFLNGSSDAFSLLANKLKKGEVFTEVNSFAGDLLGTTKLLVIPSGGLSGLENSEFLKALLEAYVKNGGTLVVLAQQHGYEFSALPTPDGNPISAYGWSEDQSCFINSAYIDTWHEVLSGQSRSTPTLNVDGYFTSYPANSSVLLRRTANGQPALLMYDYGQGKVIVTSMYTDQAYARSQASSEELALVRDLLTWAKNPAVLPEIRPGGSVSLNLTVVNNAAADAASVKIYVYSPDRGTLISQQTVDASVLAGQSAALAVSATASTVLGIYHVDYELLDSNGNIIQPQAETDSGRFAVSSPPSNPYQQSGLKMAVNTPSESIVSGQDVTFSVNLWNYNNQDQNLQLYRSWDHGGTTFLEAVTVPAQGSLTHNYTIAGLGDSGGHTLWVHVYSPSGAGLLTGWKVFRMAAPAVAVAVATDKPYYAVGDTV